MDYTYNSVFPYICRMNLRWKIAQAAEIKWWQQYLKGKNTSDYLDWKRNYWKQLLLKTELDLVPGADVLDAGCGPAGIFIIFEQQRVTAIDPLLERYRQSITHFDSKDYAYVNFQSVALEEFDKKACFDQVFCLNAINHVANIELAMDRLIAALKPGGKLVISIDAHNNKWLKRIFRLLPGDILHPHQYDFEEYMEMVTSRGCRIDKTFLQKKEMIFNYYVIVATK